MSCIYIYIYYIKLLHDLKLLPCWNFNFIVWSCPIGFTHDEDHDSQQCSKCMAAAGCHNGKCARVDPMDENSAEIPGTCYCEEGFTGPLCDLLQCK